MDDIFEREKVIAYQNFDAAIAVGVLTIGLNLGYYFFYESYKPAVLLLSSISNIAFWFFFRNYLRNFWAEEAIYWATRNIAAVVAMAVLTLSFDYIRHHVQKPLQAGGVVLYALFFMSLLFVFIFAVYACVQLGIRLRNIKNDFIGLLNELGKIYCYVEGPLFFSVIVVSPIISKYVKNNIPYHLAVSLIAVLPIFILIAIFLRAKKYRAEYVPGTNSNQVQ